MSVDDAMAFHGEKETPQNVQDMLVMLTDFAHVHVYIVNYKQGGSLRLPPAVPESAVLHHIYTHMLHCTYTYYYSTCRHYCYNIAS